MLDKVGNDGRNAGRHFYELVRIREKDSTKPIDVWVVQSDQKLDFTVGALEYLQFFPGEAEKRDGPPARPPQ